jgi:beta-glucosidase
MVPHGYSRDDKQAGEQSLNAGVDMDMQGGIFMNNTKKSLEEGKVTEKDINDAVRRILAAKYDLGLFEDPYKYCDEEREKRVVMSQANLDAARRIARKSIVLLKNDNETLPLKKTQKVALIGPFANDKRSLIGSWSAAGDWTKARPLLPAMQEYAPGKITYSRGCNISDDSLQILQSGTQGCPGVRCGGIVPGRTVDMSGEAASRARLGLPGIQQQLFDRIQMLGKPVVVVLMNGRPLCIRRWMPKQPQWSKPGIWAPWPVLRLPTYCTVSTTRAGN